MDRHLGVCSSDEDGLWQASLAFVFAAKGCPDDEGVLRCERTLFPNFKELAQFLDGKIEAERLRLGDKADGQEDIFRSEESVEDESEIPQDGYSVLDEE